MKTIKLFFKYLFITFVVVIFCSSCEGYRCAIGTVYDFETKLPIDSVKCVVLTGTEIQYTDSVGKFNVCNNFGGCVPKCSDIQIEFSKIGYKAKIIVNPNNDDVFLEKE